MHEASGEAVETLQGEQRAFRPGRRLVLIIENDRLQDGDEMDSVAIPELREYVAMLEQHRAGNSGFEVYEKPDGTKLTAIGTTWGADEIPYAPVHWSLPTA